MHWLTYSKTAYLNTKSTLSLLSFGKRTNLLFIFPPHILPVTFSNKPHEENETIFVQKLLLSNDKGPHYCFLLVHVCFLFSIYLVAALNRSRKFFRFSLYGVMAARRKFFGSSVRWPWIQEKNDASLRFLFFLFATSSRVCWFLDLCPLFYFKTTLAICTFRIRLFQFRLM